MSVAGLNGRAQPVPGVVPTRNRNHVTVGHLSAITKRLVLGPPLASNQLHETLLSKVLALPVFSSDALSSVAYASQEILLVLGLAGAGALSLVTPISFAVAGLFVVVVVSYRQTVHAYPTGGGAYRVAHENLGVYPGLLAAAALLIDYVLTVSVSVTAGTDALVSAVPALGALHLPMALSLLAIVAVTNLRGARQSATFFSIPTYGFVAAMFALILVGLLRCVHGCPQAASAGLHPVATGTLSLFLVLRAFAAGTTALTGVEAISNGVPAFREPRSHNAAATLAAMGAIAVTMFLGISWLAHATHVVYTQNSHSTALAQVAEAIFGTGPMFFVVQAMTAAILVLAANTAYQDFPRLSSILARDRYMPRAFMNRGDRLVFSNGIVTLALLAGGLLVLFDADLTRLIQLYLVGVFVSFTLSQSGMVVRWRHTHDKGWRRRAAANGAGAFVTGVVLVVVLTTKFLEGAWMVTVAIPLVILAMRSVRAHYSRVDEELSVPAPPLPPTAPHRAVVLLERLDAAAVVALAHARAIPDAEVSSIWMGSGPLDMGAWEAIAPSTAVAQVGRDAASTSLVGVDEKALTTVVVPVTVGSWPLPHVIAPSNRLRRATRKALTSGMPVQLLESIVHDEMLVSGGRQAPPAFDRVCVLVSSLDASSRRAIEFARRLGIADIRAGHIVLDPVEGEALTAAWQSQGMDLRLELHEAPFRHFGASLADYITGLRAGRPDGGVIVVVPEVVVERTGRSFLHSHTIRAVRRALLEQTSVAIVTVPFHVAPKLRAGVSALTPIRRHEEEA